MLEPLRNPANWDNFRKGAVLVLIIWAAASVLFGIPAPADIFRALILLVPSSDWLKFKNPEAPQLGGRRRRTGGNNA